jgi:acyl dehydratase
VADDLKLGTSRLPSIWASYPRVLLLRRPPVASVSAPPQIEASVAGVHLDPGAVGRYARMCGFEEAGGIPVTFPHILAMPLHLKIFAQRAFALRPMGLIHLSNWIEPLGPLAAGARVDVHVAAGNYRPTDAGLAFDMATEIRCDGEPRWRETCVFLSRWPDDAARPAGRPPRPPKAPRDSDVLAEFDVSMRTAWSYARVSGDYNPIHLSHRAARFFGLRGAIAHGMWSLARSFAEAPVPAIAAGTRLETQFLTPVLLPARVVIKQWQAEGQVRRALCDVRTGRVHMVAWWPAVTPA